MHALMFDTRGELNLGVLKGLKMAGISESEANELHKKFQSYFPKLSDLLAVGRGIPQDEVPELKNRFNLYFPHLSSILSSGGSTTVGG
jgi:hypothetical protein